MRITRYHTKPPTQAEGDQIIAMVKDYVTDLSLVAVPPSNLLYEFYRWALSTEVGFYMVRIGLTASEPVELLLAFDNATPNEVAGFLLYSPIPTHPEACGVNYMAVKESYRRRGIGSELVKTLIELYPYTELTCAIKKVPFYQSLGFQVLDHHVTQVVMNTRTASCDGEMAIVNVESIYESDEANAVKQSLLQRWGMKEIKRAQKQMERHTDELCRQAEAFYLASKA
ncbi:GNAT family N-acetyltransferase (plasmid) [Pseudomonas tremae]|uniref:GNAT family N-acetyltransferase n=1 Tax=Pseudomonas syringae group TaxID=136849 RepID=UPI000EFF15CA|nr:MULTISPECIES: GNAT family N-acetyltransferase [Pseudomonas syringae group]MCF5715919.1 GNAT family N-acetyltransferase [Pseudomonas tremae]RMR74844.1 putative acetyltransferase [Pseudomonas savastanoi pv. fraxini]UQB34497.1 GNAT family N-acetyltransferase [Pseudomonas tremae]